MEDRKWKMEDGRGKMEGGLHSPISTFHSPFSILHDRRGAIAVQTFLLLPIFVLVVFGGYEFLRAMSVKQALHDGTYQAVRYLSLNPITESRSQAWEDVARTLILQELEAEVGDEAGLVQVTVPRRPGHTPPWCGDRFEVRATFRWTFNVPFADSIGPLLFYQEREGWVICS